MRRTILRGLVTIALRAHAPARQNEEHVALVSHGMDLRVTDVLRPQPGRDEVLVRIAASGVNPLDTKTFDGAAAHARHAPPTICRSPPQPGNIEMLLFIILALLVMLAKSLIALLATEAAFRFDAAVAIAGLFSYIFWPPKTTGKRLDCRRSLSVAEGHSETSDHSQYGIAVRRAGRPIAGSSLVRRLVRAKDDPAKQRIRTQLSAIDDEGLLRIGPGTKRLSGLISVSA
jgi:hypothetical protein